MGEECPFQGRFWKVQKKRERHTCQLYRFFFFSIQWWECSARGHDLLQYRYMDDVIENLFSLFCSMWRTVLKMFVRLFRIKASESLEKCLAWAMYKEEKWRNADNNSSWLLENAWTTRNLGKNISEHQEKCDKNISATLTCGSCCNCFYHTETSSVIYYWTDARQHEIYMLNWELLKNNTKLILPNKGAGGAWLPPPSPPRPTHKSTHAF